LERRIETLEAAVYELAARLADFQERVDPWEA
jgi:hypothetical protein